MHRTSALQKFSLLLLSVALLSLSLAPVKQFYLAWIGLVPWLLVLSQTHTKKSAFFWSWLTGTLFFLANMWWLWKVSLPGMIVLLIYLGLFWGFAGWMVFACGLIPTCRASFRARRGISDDESRSNDGDSSLALAVTAASASWQIASMVLMAIVWVALEWTRGTWSMFGKQGLPWLFLGTTQSPLPVMCQVADLGGVYAVSFWVALVNFAIFFLIVDRKNWRPASAVAGACALVAIYGCIRMSHAPTRPGPTVVVIQPNYKQSNTGEKGASPDEILNFHVETTKAALADCAKRGLHVDLVAWSETMMPPLNPEVRLMAKDNARFVQTFDTIATIAEQNHASILVGAMYVNWNDAGVADDRRNSAYLFQPDGTMALTRYDKIHLVPFGEFIPFDSIPIVHSVLMKLGPSGYEDYVLTPGDERSIAIFQLPAFQLPGAHVSRFATPICFEDLVGPLVAEMIRGPGASKRADFIVNLTNDGWFQPEAKWANEMSQHFQSAIFRSIENRVPTARSVNTGVSGFIDSVGCVHDIVGANESGWSVAQLQLDDRTTFYTRYDDVFVELCAAISGLLIVFGIFRKKSTRRREDAKARRNAKG